MRVALERLDAQGLIVELPGTNEERVAVRSATRLRGVLATAGDRLELSETSAESVVLEALRVVLGDLVLSNAGGATMQGVRMSLVQERATLALDVAAGSLACADLGIVIAVDDVVLAFGLKLTAASLSVRDAEGSLSAENVELTDFSLRVGDLRLASPAVSGRAVAIRWGAKGFALDAAALDAASLEVVSGDDSRVTLGGVHVDALALAGPTIAAGHVAAERGRVEVVIAPPARSQASTTTPITREGGGDAARFLDWRALDGLSGEIDVDLEVDLTVPLIGHRKATHRFRVPIAGGSLDYRELESNLAALENALIDFAVKDGALRLERVNPLFPARGHGKPIVIWDLDATDLALAEQERVRLAVLPSARLADAGGDGQEAHESAKKSSIALRRLALHRIDVKLALAPVEGVLTGQFRPRNVGSLVLQGTVDHAPEAAQRAGSLLGELAGLAASVVGLPLGESTLDAATLELASASPIEVAFVDVHPVKVQLDLSGVAADAIRLSPRDRR